MSDGTLCGPLDLPSLNFASTSTFYSKQYVPPLDYVVPTVASLAKVRAPAGSQVDHLFSQNADAAVVCL